MVGCNDITEFGRAGGAFSAVTNWSIGVMEASQEASPIDEMDHTAVHAEVRRGWAFVACPTKVLWCRLRVHARVSERTERPLHLDRMSPR